MESTMNTEHDNRHKLVEAHIYQHRNAENVRTRHAFNPGAIKPKAKAGAIKERQTYERFGF